MVFPAAEVNGHTGWYYTRDNNCYTAGEIMEYRHGIADTYAKIGLGSLATATVTLTEDGYTYNGRSIHTCPTVTLAEKTLLPDTDYDVASANNTNAGTATVTVTGIGGYTGTAGATFTISRASLSGAAVTPSKASCG